MSKFAEVIQKYAVKIGWLIGELPGTPENSLNLVKTDDYGKVEDIFRVELNDEQIVVFTNFASPLYPSADDIPANLSVRLLHQNSKTKGFWGMTGTQLGNEKGLIIYYCYQTFLPDLNETTFRAIVKEMQSESNAVSQLFE